MLDRGDDGSRSVTKIVPGDVDHAPPQERELVPSEPVTVPTLATGMPPVAVSFDREPLCWVREIDDRYKVPTRPYLMLKDRLR